MSKENSYKYLIVGLIVLGSILRLTLFGVSPPNNGYDDHLEPMHVYAQDFSRPALFQCWECYQPPVYYYTGALFFKISKGLGGDNLTNWKAVQLINPLLSILSLIIAYQILLLFKLQNRLIALVLSFIALLPRDIFTSVMVGNDTMLAFFTVLAFYVFLKTLRALKKGNSVGYWFVTLVVIAALGSLTKQHGLLIHLFPGIVVLLLCKKAFRKMLYWAIPILLLGTLLSLSDEVWKYRESGELLVSNQNYFDYAKKQYPGSLDKVEFFTFRIVSLYQEPAISEKTSASFCTELFARTFYDYEWRFISPKIPLSRKMAYMGYTVGLTWLVFFTIIIVSWVKVNGRATLKENLYTTIPKLAPILAAFLFMLVPFLQTLRYPYFSSMKSMFMLPGLILVILKIGSLVKYSRLAQRLGSFMIILNIAYAILLIIGISLYLENSLNHLHGPLWPIPK